MVIVISPAVRFARPKSMMCGSPWQSIMMLPGFKSRSGTSWARKSSPSPLSLAPAGLAPASITLVPHEGARNVVHPAEAYLRRWKVNGGQVPVPPLCSSQPPRSPVRPASNRRFERPEIAEQRRGTGTPSVAQSCVAIVGCARFSRMNQKCAPPARPQPWATASDSAGSETERSAGEQVCRRRHPSGSSRCEKRVLATRRP